MLVFYSEKTKMPKRTRTKSDLLAEYELIPDRFYFVIFSSKAKSNGAQNSHYFTIDDELRYKPFYEDFGPLNLAHLYRYCIKLYDKLHSIALKSKKIIHFTGTNPQKQANAAYLVGSYAVLYLNMSPNEALQRLTRHNSKQYIGFRDASFGHPVYSISLLDCLNAIYQAKKLNFFDFSDFSVEEYESFQKFENRDLNWIVPGKFVAFSGPHSLSYCQRKAFSCFYRNPEIYINYFRYKEISTVVRLNTKRYDASQFTDKGFDHQDLFFPDGSTPSNELVKCFLNIAENSIGGVAVHCKGGLGRTGSMIACYIMKWYHFTAKEAIAWLRICRPGSVNGRQQKWLEQKQQEMWSQGAYFNPPKNTYGIYSVKQGELRFYKALSRKLIQFISRSLMHPYADEATPIIIDRERGTIRNQAVNKNPINLQHITQPKALKSSSPCATGAGTVTDKISSPNPTKKRHSQSNCCSSNTAEFSDEVGGTVGSGRSIAESSSPALTLRRLKKSNEPRIGNTGVLITEKKVTPRVQTRQAIEDAKWMYARKTRSQTLLDRQRFKMLPN